MDWMHHVFRSRPIAAAAIIVTAIASVLWLREQSFFQEFELSAYDRFIQLRGSISRTNSPIVLIKITESDIQRFSYPISDANFARALERLSELQADAIGVDVFSDIPGDGWPYLKQIVTSNLRIVMIEKRLGEKVAPPDFLNGRNQIGFADLKQDDDGTIRRGLLILWDPVDQSQSYLSLSLQLALKYLDDRGITLTRDPENEAFVRLGETTIPRFQARDGGYINADAGGYQFLMDYAHGHEAFQSFNLSELLDGKVTRQAIENKIVIIGTVSASVPDRHETPFTSGGAAPLSGVEIHAHTVDQLIRIALQGDSPLRALKDFHEIALIVVMSVLGSAVGFLFRSLPLLVLGAAGFSGLVFLASYGFFMSGWWWPVVAPSLGGIEALISTIAYTAMLEYTERKSIMQLFGKYVSHDVAARLWKQREHFLEDGRPRPEKLVATVMMTDLKDYTSACEKRDPADVMDWLNSYMNVMTRIVEAHGGIVEDYAGDGLKASFGTPVPCANEDQINRFAASAVDCALEIGQEISAINACWTQQGFPVERLRIGISTGSVIAGSVGSSHRMAYTTIGDTVNVAARLESFDKEGFERESTGSFRILIADSTWHRLGRAFYAESIGSQHIRGRQQPVSIYRVFNLNNMETQPTGEQRNEETKLCN